MNGQEFAELAKKNRFETCSCCGGETYRDQRHSTFLCQAFVGGKCSRREGPGKSNECNYAERGWTYYKPLPILVREQTSATSALA